MVTRRTDARRRRVLSEEFVPTDETAVARGGKLMQAYSFGANRRNQPKTTDLIPKRAVALTMFFLLLGGIVAALNAMAWYAGSLEAVVGAAGVKALAIFGSGTLANWFCCVSLFLCAGICLQLFLLRKHKRDDYGGMYRVWILMAVMFALASIDCAIDLRTIGAKLFEHVTHRSLLQTPWLMMTIESIVLAIIVIRMLFEVRASRVSLAATLLVWIGFVGCIVLRNVEPPESLPWVDPKMAKTAYGNCILLGCVGSLATLILYARFVFLHAHGLIQLKIEDPPAVAQEQPAAKSAGPVKSTKARKTTAAQKTPANKKTQSPTETPATSRPAPQPTSAPKPARKSPAAKPAASPVVQQRKVVSPGAQPTAQKPTKSVQPAAPQQPTVEEEPTVPLSKSERRRQRKLAKRAAREKKAA